MNVVWSVAALLGLVLLLPWLIIVVALFARAFSRYVDWIFRRTGLE